MSINLQYLCFISKWYGDPTIKKRGTLVTQPAASWDIDTLPSLITHELLPPSPCCQHQHSGHCGPGQHHHSQLSRLWLHHLIPLHLSYNASIYLPPPAVVWKVFSNWLNVSWAISSGHCQCLQFQCKRKTQDSNAYKLWQHHCSTLRLILNPLF